MARHLQASPRRSIYGELVLKSFVWVALFEYWSLHQFLWYGSDSRIDYLSSFLAPFQFFTTSDHFRASALVFLAATGTMLSLLLVSHEMWTYRRHRGVHRVLHRRAHH